MQRSIGALLSWWSRPAVLGNRLKDLRLTPGDTVVYVLQRRSCLDGLALHWAVSKAGCDLPSPAAAPQLACLDERAGNICLVAAESCRPDSRQRDVQSGSLSRLLTACRQDPELDIKLVPVACYWGHAPETATSGRRAKPGGRWAFIHRLKRIAALFAVPGHSLIQFYPHLSLRSLVDELSDTCHELDALTARLQEVFARYRMLSLGPELPLRRSLIQALASAPRVEAAIAQQACRSGTSRASVSRLVKQHARGIATRMAYWLVPPVSLLLSWLWQRLYEGVQAHGLETLKEAAPGHRLVYVPSHRSHIDYLLLSYLLYHQGLALPHIATGQNLNLFLLGPILRRCGGFFMRRSFQGDALYRAVFQEYLSYIMQLGFPVEFFIEGGRSRSGHLLHPRSGMIAMLVENLLRDPEKPVLLVPVYFGYERVLEAESYRRELNGEPKRKESVFDLIRIFRALDLPFGQVYVNFGQPIELLSYLRAHLGDNWQRPGVNERRHACEQLATSLARNINAAAAVTPVNLVATALLSTPDRAMTVEALSSSIETYLILLRKQPLSADCILPEASIAELLLHAERVMQLQSSYRDSVRLLYVEPESALSLTWYRNNTLHLFVLPALIATLIDCLQEVDCDELLKLLTDLVPLINRDLGACLTTSSLPENLNAVTTAFSQLGLLAIEGSQQTLRLNPEAEMARLLPLRDIIKPVLARHCLLLKACLATTGADQQPESDVTRVEVARRLCLSMAAEIGSRHAVLVPELQEGLFSSGLLSWLLQNRKACSSLYARLIPLIQPAVRADMSRLETRLPHSGQC